MSRKNNQQGSPEIPRNRQAIAYAFGILNEIHKAISQT